MGVSHGQEMIDVQLLMCPLMSTGKDTCDTSGLLVHHLGNLTPNMFVATTVALLI